MNGEMLKTSDFYFDLPPELIAQDPLTDRSASRLLVLDKNTGEIKHEQFRNIINYLNPGNPRKASRYPGGDRGRHRGASS